MHLDYHSEIKLGNRKKGRDNDSIRCVGVTKGADYLFHARHTSTRVCVWVVTCCSSSFSLSSNRTHTKKKEKRFRMNIKRNAKTLFHFFVVVVEVVVRVVLDCDGTILDFV